MDICNMRAKFLSLISIKRGYILTLRGKHVINFRRCLYVLSVSVNSGPTQSDISVFAHLFL